MSFLSDARKAAKTFVSGSDSRRDDRDYALGSGGIPVGDFFWGADPSVYSPDEFGNYLLTSNPVYSVTSQRANYLASLPLRLFRPTEGSALGQVPRFSDIDNDALREILGLLDDTRGPAVRPDVRNTIAALSQLHERDKIREFTRVAGLEEVTDGPAWELLHRVNDFWTVQRLIRMTSLSRDIWGQSYWVVNRGASTKGQPEEIWWVSGTRMRPIPHPVYYISHYEFDPLDGSEPIPFFPWEIVRIYNANPLDEFQPMSALSSTSMYADHETASMQANMNLHEHGLNPGAIVMPINNIRWEDDQAQEIENDINERLGGVDKAHRWGVFRHEVKIDKTGITPKESEYIEGMNFDLEAVARAYDWPIDLLAGKRTYENVEMAFKRAWQTTAMEGAFVASDIAEFYIPMFDEEEVLIPFFDTSHIAVLQETEGVKWERERGQIDVVITRNEWRQGRGLTPLEGGDKLYAPARFLPLEVVADLSAEAQTPLLDSGDDQEEDDLIAEPANNGTSP